MNGSPEFAGDTAEVFDFVSMLLADRRDGREQPLEFYLARFPGHEQAIAREHARLRRDEDADRRPSRRIGNYMVLDKLGSGGQGVVLLAEDLRLHRRVALKVLAPHLDFVSTERLQRFRREAEILSQLDHPGICPVYEADTCDGAPFLAMRFVEGQTLAAIVRERRGRGQLPRTRVELHEIVRWIEQAARAAHEAHEHGIVHRDIKPGNLMITEQGQPVLLDFGLARHEAGVDAEITRTGDVLGTLAYMAPELLGRRRADRRADVYALGVTLYECVTHALPFVAETPTGLWRAIESGSATAPREHNASIPPELAAVICTAFANNPAHRYATAAEFALDLERVRRREPIHARSVPVAVRAIRWMQRHPTLSTALTAALVLIVALATSLERVRANERAASALNRAIQNSGTDEGAADALAELIAAARSSPRADLDTAMVQALDACHLAWRVPRTPVPPNSVDPPPAFDPTGSFVALGDSAGRITLRAAGDGRLRASATVLNGRVTGLAFADADHLVAAGAAKLVVLTVPTLAATTTIALPSPAAAAVALAPGGGSLAVAFAGCVRLLSSPECRPLASVDLQPPMPMRRVVFAPAGDRIAILGKDGGHDPHACTHCWIVDVASRRVCSVVTAPDQNILWVGWHPAQPVLALAYNGGRVEVRTGDDGAARFTREVGQEVNWCGFDPSGELLLVPSDRGTDLWRWAASPPTIAAHLGHSSERTIGAAAFDADQRLFAAVLRDGLVLVHSTSDWRLLRQFKHRVRDARYLDWLPGSGRLLTADLDDLSAWHAGVRPHCPEFWGHDGPVTSVAMHPDGRRVLTASRDGTARLWSLDRSTPLHQFDHRGAPLRRARFSADGRRALTVGDDTDIRVWDTASGALTATLHGHVAAPADAWFVDDQRALSIADDGFCIVWDAATGVPLRNLAASEAPLRSAALDPRRHWVAVGGADRFVTIWDLDSGAQVQRFFGSDETGDWHTNPLHQVRGIAFDPLHDRVVASLVNNVLLEWDVAANWHRTRVTSDRFGGSLLFDRTTGSVLCADYSFGRLSLWRDDRIVPLEVDGHSPHANRIAAIRIAPQGGIALSAGHDGQLIVWDLTTGTAIQSISTPSAILDADFAPDGEWIVTGCVDGTVKLWPRNPLATAVDYLARRRPGH